MRTKDFYITLFIMSFWPVISYSQTNCTVPEPPVLNTVSVDPETGNTDFSWTLSPSSNIAAYILYSYKNGDGTPVDTVWDPFATSYSLTSSASKYFSVSYVVASFRLPVIPGTGGCPSPLSNVLNTIYTTASIDSCNKKILISWNSYSSIPKKVTGYSVLVSVDGSDYTEAATVNSDENSFVFNDFEIDAEYCFVIKADLKGGFFSSSNKACLSTKMVRPPFWINADYATVNSDNTISLSFTIDPLSEIKQFRLERKSTVSGNFLEIARPGSINGTVIYIDNKANTDTIYYYRLSALNNCNSPVTVSNIASNIVPELQSSGNELKLSWNSYKTWLGQIDSYKIFLNTGNGFEEKVTLQPNDTAFTFSYRDIMYNLSGNNVCFYVSASERSNPYGIPGQSRSSDICTVATETITVPNVFTPDGDLINDFFRPVLSFAPNEYHLVISDRNGRIIFESRDFNEEWDGTQNGDHLPQGVYLWFLKVTGPSGKKISKTGTVAIIRIG